MIGNSIRCNLKDCDNISLNKTWNLEYFRARNLHNFVWKRNPIYLNRSWLRSNIIKRYIFLSNGLSYLKCVLFYIHKFILPNALRRLTISFVSHKCRIQLKSHCRFLWGLSVFMKFFQWISMISVRYEIFSNIGQHFLRNFSMFNVLA